MCLPLPILQVICLAFSPSTLTHLVLLYLLLQRWMGGVRELQDDYYLPPSTFPAQSSVCCIYHSSWVTLLKTNLWLLTESRCLSTAFQASPHSPSAF